MKKVAFFMDKSQLHLEQKVNQFFADQEKHIIIHAQGYAAAPDFTEGSLLHTYWCQYYSKDVKTGNQLS